MNTNSHYIGSNFILYVANKKIRQILDYLKRLITPVYTYTVHEYADGYFLVRRKTTQYYLSTIQYLIAWSYSPSYACIARHSTEETTGVATYGSLTWSPPGEMGTRFKSHDDAELALSYCLLAEENQRTDAERRTTLVQVHHRPLAGRINRYDALDRMHLDPTRYGPLGRPDRPA